MVGIGLSLGGHVARSANWPATAIAAADFVNNRYMVAGAPVSETSFIDCTRDSTGMALNVSGLYQNFLSDQSRITNKGLLVEPSATNIAKRSTDFNDAAWDKTRSTVTATGTTGPLGLSVFKFAETSATGSHYLHQAGVVSGTKYTITFILKQAEHTTCGVLMQTNNSAGATFDLVTGTATVVSGGVVAGVKPLFDGWFACSVTYTATATTSFALITRDKLYNGAGVAGDGVLVAQAQLEADLIATSPIITAGSPATRNADIIRCDDIATQLATLSRGIIVVDLNIPDVSDTTTDPALVGFDNGTSATRILAQITAAKDFRLYIESGGAYGTLSLGAITPGHHRVALGIHDNGDYKASLNGAATLSDTSTLTDLSGLSRCFLGSRGGASPALAQTHSTVMIMDEVPTSTRLEELSAL